MKNATTILSITAASFVLCGVFAPAQEAGRLALWAPSPGTTVTWKDAWSLETTVSTDSKSPQPTAAPSRFEMSGGLVRRWTVEEAGPGTRVEYVSVDPRARAEDHPAPGDAYRSAGAAGIVRDPGSVAPTGPEKDFLAAEFRAARGLPADPLAGADAAWKELKPEDARVLLGPGAGMLTGGLWIRKAAGGPGWNVQLRPRADASAELAGDLAVGSDSVLLTMKGSRSEKATARGLDAGTSVVTATKVRIERRTSRPAPTPTPTPPSTPTAVPPAPAPQ